MSDTQWFLVWVLVMASFGISLFGLFFDYHEWRDKRKGRR